MADYILIDGDTVNFDSSFGAATVVVAPGTLTASGKASLNGKMVCIEGDEDNVSVPGCNYIMGAYLGGNGTLSIDSLGSDQTATKTNSDGTAVLLVGSQFTATFTEDTPAQTTSSPPQSDSASEYSGTGSFETTNTKWQGT